MGRQCCSSHHAVDPSSCKSASRYLVQTSVQSDVHQQAALSNIPSGSEIHRGKPHAFHAKHAKESPAMLARLQQAVIHNENVFEVLMDAVRVCSLGQITNALFEVGGQYRRNM